MTMGVHDSCGSWQSGFTTVGLSFEALVANRWCAGRKTSCRLHHHHLLIWWKVQKRRMYLEYGSLMSRQNTEYCLPPLCFSWMINKVYRSCRDLINTFWESESSPERGIVLIQNGRLANRRGLSLVIERILSWIWTVFWNLAWCYKRADKLYIPSRLTWTRRLWQIYIP